MHEICDAYGLSTAAYFFQGLGDRVAQEPVFLTTYTQSWVDHYQYRNFVRIDPVLQIGFQSFMPVDWAQLNRERKHEVTEMFGEAKDFGLGGRGITFPIHCNMNGKALFSLSADMKAEEWTKYALEYFPDFQMLGHAFHECVRSVLMEDCDPPQLTRRQTECLLWISAGKTAGETAAILGLAERTVRCYLDEAKQKLDATNITQAAVKANRMNLLLFYQDT